LKNVNLNFLKINLNFREFIKSNMKSFRGKRKEKDNGRKASLPKGGL